MAYRELSYEEAKLLWDCGHREIEWQWKNFFPADKTRQSWSRLGTSQSCRPDSCRDAKIGGDLGQPNRYIKRFRIEVVEDVS